MNRCPPLPVVALLALAFPVGGAAQLPPPPVTAKPARDDWATWTKTACLLDLETHFIARGSDVTGTIRLAGDDAFWKTFAEGEKPLTASSGSPPPVAFLRVTVESDTPPLTTAERKTGRSVPRVAKPRWITVLPIRGRTLPFTVPAAALPRLGDYRVVISFVSPRAGVKSVPARRRIGEFNNEFEQPPTVRFSVVAPRELVLKATATDAPVLLRNAIRVGDPNRVRFPKDDSADGLARGVKDLFAYRGRLFVGCGDWGANRGPIDIWAYLPPDPGVTTGQWMNEFTVDDESIDLFREWNDRLYIPGIDAREDHSFGNIYIRENGRWAKRRTVPRAFHVLDTVGWRGDLYACGGIAVPPDGAAGGLYVSRDNGQSWVPCGSPSPESSYAFRFWRAAPLGDRLMVFDNHIKQGIWEWDGTTLRHRAVDILPGSKNAYFATNVDTVHPFAGGILYTVRSADHQFYFLRDTARGAVQCDVFGDGRGAIDILVEDTICYVLRRRRVGETWEGSVYATKDLLGWTRVAMFSLPGPPSAVTRLNGTFYVGIGNDRANPSAGTVWRIE